MTGNLKKFGIISLGVITAAVALSASDAFARPGRYGRRVVVRHHDDAAAAGFLAGLLVSTASISSLDILLNHPAETLLAEAAQFQLTEERGTVFALYADNNREAIAEFEGVTVEEMNDDMIASLIIENIQ